MPLVWLVGTSGGPCRIGFWRARGIGWRGGRGRGRRRCDCRDRRRPRLCRDTDGYAAIRAAGRDAASTATGRAASDYAEAAEGLGAAAVPYGAEAATDYAEAEMTAREAATRTYCALYSAIVAGRVARDAAARADVARADVARADVARADVARADMARAAAPATTTTTATTTDLCEIVDVIGGTNDAYECKGYRAVALGICGEAEREGVAPAVIADRWNWPSRCLCRRSRT